MSAKWRRHCRWLDASDEVCDFCFLDPPYHMRGAYERTLEFLGESRLVGPSSIVIAEHEKKFDLGENLRRAGAISERSFRVTRR